MCVSGGKCPAEGLRSQSAPRANSGTPATDQRGGDEGVEERG